MMDYNKYLTTFRKASLDIIHGISLIDSDEECFSLDRYFEKRFEGNVERPKSVDTIYSKNKDFDNTNYFIEFKNQRLNNISVSDNYEKIYNSVIVFIGDNNLNLDFCIKHNYLFIVVNNSNDKLILHLNNLTKKNGLKGIEKFKGYCFNDVSIKTEGEFINKIEISK